jgi:hypothetical protein
MYRGAYLSSSHVGPHPLALVLQPSMKFHHVPRPYLFVAPAPPPQLVPRRCPHPVLSPCQSQPFHGVARSLCPSAAPIGQSNDGSRVPPRLVSATPPPTIVFPIESMKASRAPSRGRRSVLNTALGAMGTQGGQLDSARASTSGGHVPLDRSTDALYQETSMNMGGFRHNSLLKCDVN